MPTAHVRGIAITYEIIGREGPWVALATGGRNPYGEFVSLSRKIAAQGFRVVLHDRRNCGASEVALDTSESEDEHRVSDWQALLGQLGATPAFMGGSSSGCRMALRYFMRDPKLVRGLLLLRVTGGAYPAKHLPENYYGQFIRVAEHGGMAAVCAMDHWKACIAARPENGRILMSMPPERFIAVMTAWRTEFLKGVDLPVIGMSAAELAAIKVPTIIIPGNDKVHSSASGKLAASLIPGARLHELPLEDTGAELVWFSEWAAHEDEMATVFVDFMRKTLAAGTAR